MTFSDAARRILTWLHEEYVKAGHPNHNVWMFRPAQEDVAAFNELRANCIIEPCEIARNSRWRLTDFGLRKLLETEGPADLGVSVHHHGDVHMGSTFTTNITGSTIGAIATGDHPVATGTVNLHQGPLTQAQHLEHIKVAKKALADDEERLEGAVHEALEKFLKSAREVKVEAKPMGEVQAEMEGILERVWAVHQGKALPQELKVTRALAQSPAMAGVAKRLLRG